VIVTQSSRNNQVSRCVDHVNSAGSKDLPANRRGL
jgi:hypothetical protein